MTAHVSVSIDIDASRVHDWRELLAGLAYRHGFDGSRSRLVLDRGRPTGALVLPGVADNQFPQSGLDALGRDFEKEAAVLLSDVQRTRALAHLEQFEAFKARVDSATAELRSHQRALRAAATAAEVVERAGAVAASAEKLLTFLGHVLPSV